MAGCLRNIPKILLVLSLGISSLWGQNVEELSDQELNTKVIELVKENEFLEARPFLLEMKKRMEEQETDETKETMEAIAFFLASSYLEEYQNDNENEEALKTAVKSFTEYIEKYPSGPRRTIALLNLGDAYSDLKQYDKAISTYEKIFNSSTTSGSVRNDMRRVIAKTYLKTDKPEEGIPYYLDAYEQAIIDEEARAEAATWLLQGYLAKGEIEAILPYFSELTGRKAALFNPKFNVTLIKAGDKLFENGNYDFAILFYAIVKKKEDIVAFYEQAVEQLELALSYKQAGSESAIEIEKRLREAEANLKAVKGIRDYDADVRWRSARVLLESERTWEALWSFYNLMLDYPEHEQAEEFLFLAFSQARRVNDYFMVVKLAKDYLGRKDYNKYRDQITMDLATYYRDQGMQEDFYELTTDYLNGAPGKDKVSSQVVNLLSIHLLEKERYGELFQRADSYISKHSNLEDTQESSEYWSALALTIAADYNRALERFNAFLDKYGDRSVFSEDAYYRRAICLYGAQRANEAYKEFTDFVKKYPKSTRRGEAELYLGDIQRENGKLDSALGHYEKVEDYAKSMTFITKATFAISEVLEVKGREGEAAQTLLTYVDKYGKEAELGEAYLRLGRFEERQGRPDRRFEYNTLGLEATANNPNRYAADQILLEYARDYPRYVRNYEAAIELIDAMLADSEYRETMLKDRAVQYTYFQSKEGMEVDPNFSQRIMRDRAFRRNLIESPEENLRELRAEYTEKLESIKPYKPEQIFERLMAKATGDKLVLELRILMAREKLSDTDLMFPFTDDQVEKGSPAVMLWRARKLMDVNPAKADALLEVSLNKHPYAPNRYDTMLTMAEIAMNKAEADPSTANWEAALVHYENLIGRFGMRAEGGTPFLAKGEILIELGREEEAKDVLSNVLRNPEWRGKAHAVAHLQLGIAYYKTDNFAQAHGFFERLMLGFGGFRNEVAMAYYWDLKTLEAMNESESVNKLLTEIRKREDLKDTEGYRLIEENYAL